MHRREENHGRDHAPWSSRALTRGLEFGSYAFAMSRRWNVEQGTMFDTCAHPIPPADASVALSPLRSLPRGVLVHFGKARRLMSVAVRGQAVL